MWVVGAGSKLWWGIFGRDRWRRPKSDCNNHKAGDLWHDKVHCKCWHCRKHVISSLGNTQGKTQWPVLHSACWCTFSYPFPLFLAGCLSYFKSCTRQQPHSLNDFLCEQVEKFIAGLSVEDLPGVGWMLRNKLHSHKLYKCSDLLSVSKV